MIPTPRPATNVHRKLRPQKGSLSKGGKRLLTLPDRSQSSDLYDPTGDENHTPDHERVLSSEIILHRCTEKSSEESSSL